MIGLNFYSACDSRNSELKLIYNIIFHKSERLESIARSFPQLEENKKMGQKNFFFQYGTY